MIPQILLVDFETKSTTDLIACGTHAYVSCPATDIICAAFTLLDPNDERIWLWYADSVLPLDLLELIAEVDYIAAHNAEFDEGIWEYVACSDYGFPEVSRDRWYCSAAQMRVNNIPAALEKAAIALGVSERKSGEGKSLIRQLSIPLEDGTFCEDPELIKRMGLYCAQDIVTMKACMNATRLMTLEEHRDWLRTRDINELGIRVDRHLAEAALNYAAAEQEELNALLHGYTGCAINRTTQTRAMANWVADQLSKHCPEAAQYMVKYKDGEQRISLDKNIRANLLMDYENGELEFPEHIYQAVQTVDTASKTSVSKFNSALKRSECDSRVYGAFVYAGASQTLRFSSRGLQLHNFPSREGFKTTEEAERCRAKMLMGRDIESPILKTLSKMLRPMLIPANDHLFVCGDWVGVEARILPWLSDLPGGAHKLDRIASGVDVYMEAAEILRSDNRLLGKVMELSLGYEGGLNAFKLFARSYGLTGLTDLQIREIIKAWRKANDWVVEFWKRLEWAALAAVDHPCEVYTVGRLRYTFNPDLMGGTLHCILPDNSLISFPFARIEEGKYGDPQITALKASANKKQDASEWPRESLYGGRLAGIGTQGTAGALLRDLLRRPVCDPCVGHIHDEVILEVPRAFALDARLELQEDMETPPTWAPGLPLKAEPNVLRRFRK